MKLEVDEQISYFKNRVCNIGYEKTSAYRSALDKVYNEEIDKRHKAVYQSIKDGTGCLRSISEIEAGIKSLANLRDNLDVSMLINVLYKVSYKKEVEKLLTEKDAKRIKFDEAIEMEKTRILDAVIFDGYDNPTAMLENFEKFEPKL